MSFLTQHTDFDKMKACCVPDKQIPWPAVGIQRESAKRNDLLLILIVFPTIVLIG